MKLKVFTIIFILILLFVVTSCSKNTKNKFSAVVEDVTEKTIMIITADNKSFDKAAVSITDNTQITPYNSEIKIGDTITITFDGNVRESYPVQITAKKIEINSKKEVTQVHSTATAKYNKISPEEAKKIMDSEQNIVVLDVRTKEEFAEKRIKNSILVPDYELEATADEKLKDKNQLILVYCRSGRRSEASAKLLVNMGYTNVKDFGGIIDWPYETING